MYTIDDVRNCPPRDDDHLWFWVEQFTGIKIARDAVCRGHKAPFDAFSAGWFGPTGDWRGPRYRQTLTLGSRGSGKSFLAALLLHLDNRFRKQHKARILGGSKDQSRQIYEALKEHVLDGSGPLGGDGQSIAKLLDSAATYRNGSSVKILAASSTSVRGPHVQTLALDEVDEIEPDLRQSAMGMNMALHGIPATVRMTSTWHRPQGPMSELIASATLEPKPGEPDNRFPLFTYCAFEVLERCPDSRSGPNLENCDDCQLKRWCHEDRFANPSLPPKAKISDGHYAIESLIQKVQTTSRRVFEADYLCKGPKADGIWFREFDRARHVQESAEYDPALPVYLAIDSGVFTGAVWFQVRDTRHGHFVSVFGEHLSEGLSAEVNALTILDLSARLCGGSVGTICTDPAGGSRNAVGPSVLAEYERAGLKRVQRWPIRPVADGLALVESFVMSADGKPGLAIHPRCRHLIDAMIGYIRAGKAPQWLDGPKDPQHPAEDMVDALRGGLCHRFPDGRRGKSELKPWSAGRLKY